MELAANADLAASPFFVPNVDLTGWILANQHRCQAGRD